MIWIAMEMITFYTVVLFCVTQNFSYFLFECFSSVQSLSHVRLFATPWIAARQASLSITNSRSSPKLMSIESVMPSSRLILFHPLLLLPPIPPSIRVFSSESTLGMRWPKYWSFSLSISSSSEHPGLVSCRMYWLELLAVQGILKSLLAPQLERINYLALCLLYGPTFTSYMTSGKTIALTMRKFVCKMIHLLLNILCWFVMAFLPRSKGLLISWLQSPSALILEPKKMKSDTISTFPPSIHNEVMGLDVMIFTFWM